MILRRILVTAITMPIPQRPSALPRAPQQRTCVVISFTVETDGRLPTGQTLQEAVEQVDDATGRGPAYYMINCAHPTHFAGTLRRREQWLDRIAGLRAMLQPRVTLSWMSGGT